MGNLLIHVMGTYADNLSFDLEDDAISDFVRISPPLYPKISWPRSWLPLDDRGADHIANTLSRFGGYPDGWLR